MQILKSFIFNLVLYITLIPTSLIIIFLYPFISTANLQLIASKWILFILNSLKITCGVTWKIEGLKNIPEGPCVIVSNHQSAWESFFLQTLCIPSASIIKKELLFIPFFGWALACLKPIHLRRSKKYRSLKKVITHGSKKVNKGFSLIIFPEGTRSKPNEGLKAFSSSCGSLSVRNNVPILPICHNSGLFWVNRRFIKKPGEVTVRIGPIIKGQNAREVTKEAYDWMKLNFREIN